MKALVMESVGKPMVVKEVAQPECPPHGAIVRVEASGICRSDWRMWMGDWGWAGVTPQLPTILGHEIAGIVEEIGSEVKRFKPGDRVTCPPLQACGACRDCLSGHSNLCFNIENMCGGYARYAAVFHADLNLVNFAPNITFFEAASMGCRFIKAYHGVIDRARIKADETIVIYGCGGVGLSATQIAAASGARVIAVDLDDRKLVLAKKAGAEHVINAAKIDPVQAVMDLTNGGANVTLDALGIAATCRNALLSLRTRGRHVQIGLTTQKEKGEVSIPLDRIVLMEIELVGSSNMQPWRYPAMLDLVERGKVSPKALITQTLPLNKAFGVIEKMTHYSNVGISVIDRF
ncbi:MAG TPA: zinc-binding dehydrogenase [Candidatus Binataceae bacterium]|jgi:D-arabinose 1-dehydrogenase-like Zn-dependent alcohol dehydrogenase|nr:zinc-binding dehydrogenase [Candidatus Binataceae bacterium]